MLPRWLITFRALALMSAFAAAFVPIVTYITDDKRDWLWIHIAVNIAAYIAVALTTIYTTIHLTQQDHNKYRVPAYWSNNVVMRTWWLGVSRTWRWHVAAAVGRLGLALALAQHVHIISYPQIQVGFEGILRSFLYYDYNAWSGNEFLSQLYRSQWETVLIGFFVLCGFTLLEMGLLSALTLFVHYIVKKQSSISIIVILRGALVILCVLVMSIFQDSIANEARGVEEVNYNLTQYHLRMYRNKFEEWHKFGFSLIDNGTMLTAWITRPMSHDGYNYACVEFAGYDNFSSCKHYNNRPFVLLDVLAALASYATYILAIGVTLQLAHYLHWRREQGMTAHAPTDASTA